MAALSRRPFVISGETADASGECLLMGWLVSLVAFLRGMPRESRILSKGRALVVCRERCLVDFFSSTVFDVLLKIKVL